MSKVTLPLVLIASLTPVAFAAEPTLTLGPEVMTFPEIAQRLSTKERPVRCARSLENRAAFVYLKDRPWDTACDLLAAGLEVQFRPSEAEEGVFVLERAPDVMNRERRWRQRIGRGLAHAAQWVADRYQYYRNQPLEARQKRVKEIGMQLKPILDRYHQLEAKFIVSAPAEKDPKPLHAQHWRLQAFDLDIAALAPALNHKPVDDLVFPWLRAKLPPSLENVLQYGSTFAVEDAKQAPGDVLVGSFVLQRSSGYLGFITRAALVHSEQRPHYSFPALSAEVPSSSRLPACSLAEVLFAGTAGEYRPKYPGLGADALTWLRQEQAVTKQFLQTKRAREKFKRKPGQQPSALSQWVEVWSAHFEAEAVMELSPIEEQLPQDASEVAFADLFGPSSPWTLHEQDGALLVRNQLAFLDRPREFPVTALVQLSRRLRARQEARVATSTPSASGTSVSPPEVNDEELRAYYAALGAKHILWNYPTSGLALYRGVDTKQLDAALPVFYLWERLPVEERDELVTQGRGEVKLALSRFTDKDLDVVTRSLRLWDLVDNAQSWHPQFKQHLRECALVVRSKAVGGQTGTYRVSLALKPPLPGSARPLIERFTGAEAEFVWRPGNVRKLP